MYSCEKRAESAPSLYLWKARKDRPALGTEGSEMDDEGERWEGGSRDAAVLEREEQRKNKETD